MNKNLTCNQISALINFYIEGKLNPRLEEYFNNHLAKCPHCRNKIDRLKDILRKYNNKEELNNYAQYNDYKFIHELSAYIDNELNSNENIKIKKITISNPKARQELENLYKFKKAIHSAYEKTKNEIKYDYSKNILTKIQDGSEYSTTYFYKLAAIFALLITAIIAGFIYLYF